MNERHAGPPNTYSATWFDLFLSHPDREQTAREVSFLERNLPLPGMASVLDVCCGMGRHAGPLAGAGYEVLGIDRDEPVIERARLLQASDRVTFQVHDMTRLDHLPCVFDAVICMWQSFGYFDTSTNTEVLHQMAARLHSGGRLVLDIYNRDFFESRQGERMMTRRGESVVTRQQLVSDQLVVELDYLDRNERETFDWQVFTPEGIVGLASAHGLSLVVACTRFNEQQPPSAEQPRMQLVFQ